MNINEIYLVVNAGSSSLKFTAYKMPGNMELISGYFEKIGLKDSYYSININNQKNKKIVYIQNHSQAISILIYELFLNNIIDDLDEIKGVGHRVVHGGDKYSDSVVIDDEVIDTIESLIPLAPLHNPANLVGIKNMMKEIPNATHTAVFDTAFHQTIAKENYMYALPYEWYEKYKIRKYGFHGTSYKYITKRMKDILNKDDINLIICHIGGGASIAAIRNGKSYNTTMGMTPLDGIIMGTRCGSIDPSIIPYMMNIEGNSIDNVMKDLNKNSGLTGITGKSDLRDIEAKAKVKDDKAILGLEMYTNSIVKYIAEYYFELEGNIDAIVFTAGVGENQFNIRKSIVDKISNVTNIKLDSTINNNIASYKDIKTGMISTKDSNIQVWVVPTDEELMILEDTYELTNQKKEKGYVKRKNIRG